jgi:hypothetical protein
MSQITFLDDERPSISRSRSPKQQVPVNDATFDVSPTVQPPIPTQVYPQKELFNGPLPSQYQNNLTFSPLPIYTSSFNPEPSSFQSPQSMSPQQGFQSSPQQTSMYSPVEQNNFQTAMYDMNGSKYMSMNCIDIANHIRYCPVCSQLHKSQAPMFISIIVILIIIAVCLGKKHFE